MVKVCAVKSCSSKRLGKNGKKKEPVSFFQPTTPFKLQRWAKSLGFPLKGTDYICQFHFKEGDIKMYDKTVIGNTIHLHILKKKILKDEALPEIKHQFEIYPELQQLVQQKLEQKQQQLLKQQTQQQQLRRKQHLLQVNQKQPRQESHEIIIIHEQQPQIPEKTNPIAEIKNKILGLPPHWLYVDKPNQIEFMRLDPASKRVLNHILFNEDSSITVICSNNEKINVGDKKIASSGDIFDYLKYVEKWPLCVGILGEKKRFAQECKGVIIGEEAYQRQLMNPRCKSCRVRRRQLLSRKNTSNSIMGKSIALKRRNESIVRQFKRKREQTTKAGITRKATAAKS